MDTYFPQKYSCGTQLGKEYQYFNKSQALKAKEFRLLVMSEFQILCPTLKNKLYYTHINHTTRFLVAQDFKMQKALESWRRWYQWRNLNELDDIKEEMISNEIKSGKLFIQSCDKDNRPCIIFKPGNHFPKESSLKDDVRLGVYIIDKAIRIAQKNNETKIVMIWDKDNLTQDNIDDQPNFLLKILFDEAHDFYIDRIHAIYILNPKWFYKNMFNIIKPILTKKAKSKLKFLNNTSDLVKYFVLDDIQIQQDTEPNTNLIEQSPQVVDYTYDYTKKYISSGKSSLIPSYLEGESFISITIEKNDSYCYCLTKEQDSFDTRLSDTDERILEADIFNNNNNTNNTNTNNNTRFYFKEESCMIAKEYFDKDIDDDLHEIENKHKPYGTLQFNFKKF